MTIETKIGIVHFESHITFDRIQDLIFSYEFASDEHYNSIFTTRGNLEHILEHDGHVALALLDNKTIIGYAALGYPMPKERWAGIGRKIVIELKAVEVLPEYRSQGVARHLVSLLLSDTKIEQKIIYLTSYIWIWDLDCTGLNAQSYKSMLIKLYERFEFKEYFTNEPNVCLKPENIFMVRVGKHVLQKHQEVFKWLRFGLRV